MKRALSHGTLALLALSVGLPAGADVVQIPSLKDNTLYESATGASSNGAGEHLFTGRVGTGEKRRGVIAFDVATNVPAGATITGATLTLNMSMTQAGPQTVELHRLTADWGEGTSDAAGGEGGGAASTTGDATWIHTFFSTQFWASAGGDFAGAVSASQTVDAAGSYSWSGAGLAADAQGWLDDPSSNHGWALVGGEAAAGTTKRFDTKELIDSALRPVLTVEFEPSTGVPAVSGWGALLLALALSAVSAFALRRRGSRSA